MGYFDKVEDAARAYDRQAVQIHGRLGESYRATDGILLSLCVCAGLGAVLLMQAYCKDPGYVSLAGCIG